MITTEDEKKRGGIALLLKCVLAALPLIVFILMFIFLPMHLFDREYAMWLYQKQRTHDRSVEADVIVLGDSLMMSGVEPDKWGDDIQNLALGGATPVEMEYTLETYLDNHSAPKLIIMGYGHNHYLEMSSYWTRTVYFHYLPFFRQLELISRIRDTHGDDLLNEKNVLIKTCAYAAYSPDQYLPACLAAMSIDDGRSEENEEKYEFCVRSRGYYAFGNADCCGEPSTSIEYDAFNVPPVMDEYLRRIFELCRENDIALVVERPPYNQASEDAIDATFAEQYTAYFDSLAAEYPNVIMNTVIEVYPDDCFGDEAGHLNARGAERYTESLFERYAYLAAS